ncbi:ATP-dependent translocase ABCB1 isoform X35 [Brienomyrus brachyistius]|uniref:ATP-dependent translocase ABCB1 isoform X35 n=1 Tax=Brienomyrus brachyistius TaxID=42636 RepID=UPI0020B22A53|nr:ATP-dependent translocase ABCB1 isoform X35 [Brienomyrus brachyistius]
MSGEVSQDALYANSYINDAFVEDEKRREDEKDPPPPEEPTPASNKKGLFRRKRKEPKEPVKLVGFFQLLRFAKPPEIILMIVGLLCAAANGVTMPLMNVVYGHVTDIFVKSAQPFNLTGLGNVTNSSKCLINPEIDIEALMATRAYYFVGIGVAVFIVGTCQVTLFLLAATRQTKRIRERYFHSVIHQQMGWFDTHQVGVLITRLTDDINTINEGLGEKICLFVQYFCAFIAGIIIGFINGWKLTLVVLAVSPLLAGSAAVWSKIVVTLISKELSAYAKAGAVAEEFLVAIRTVVAFNGQKKAVEKYESNLEEARNFGEKKAITINVAMGLTHFISLGMYALAFWYGTKLTVDEPENYSIGRVLTVFSAVRISALSLGRATPILESVARARGAAYEIYKTIDLPRPIDSSSKEGHKPETVKGDIEFKNIHFSYPSRKDAKILQGVNLVVPRGKTIALVGASGCGKSTIIQLLQRFYDPDAGEITLDGHDIRTLNVKWLRENIGIVSQEPVLFATTIAENIRYGWENATDEDIERAVKEANAYEFISELPDKMNTMVGERGAQLSGGQKQRITIARALVKNPKILLLDEATSALDPQGESIVEAALDKARAGRTTIIITHRLSTIKTADIIVGFSDGVVTEQGTHSQLMALKGVYYSLVMQQNLGKEKNATESSEDEMFDENLEEDPHYIEILTHDVGEYSTSQNISLRCTGNLRRRSSKKKKKKKKFLKKPADKENKEEQKGPEVLLKRILALNKPEWPYLLIGVLSSLISGAVYPCVSIVFAKIIGVFAETDPDVKRQKTQMLSLLLLLIAVVAFVIYFVQGYMFSKSGELLTMRLRSQCFRAMMGQEIGFFDDSRNAVGVLTTKLATDTSLVKGVAGSRLGLVTNTICALTIAIVVAFIFCWHFTLLVLVCMPFLSGANFIQMRATGGHASTGQNAPEHSGQISTETVENFRTVVSLSQEEVFFQRFKDSLSSSYKTALRRAPTNGITYALAQVTRYFVNAAIFRFGAWLTAHCYTQYENVFLVYYAILFTAMNVGQLSSFPTDFTRAKASARRILTLLDRKPEIDIYSEKGDMPGTCTGNIEFHDVHFMYPTRRNVNVLQGLNVSVSSGQTLALVGGSGCGKSTSIQLLQRFYDVASGHVSLDGHDIKSLNLAWLRSQLGLVSQDPILFDCSIAENIQYGDNSRDVSQTEIEEAAKSANIHTFIQSLPETYNTRVGDKGAQLSGGQKQMIAIARALVRHPKVLLLDEATSALDNKSKKIVQQALDKARLGRTCVVIAHRLSTIQNADIIAVIQNGRVVEQGTHSQLMQREGAYYALVNAQVSH